MKAFSILLSFVAVAAAISGDEQAVFSAVGDALTDVKQTILNGKQEMDKWMHDGKEFIKQNNFFRSVVPKPATKDAVSKRTCKQCPVPQHVIVLHTPSCCDQPLCSFSSS